MDHLLEDIRYSLRSLAAAPGFLTVAAATIAVGIGATTAIFSVVHAVLLLAASLSGAGPAGVRPWSAVGPWCHRLADLSPDPPGHARTR